MIKKLQKRFLLLAAGSLFLLLFLIVISSALLNYRTLIQEADSILSVLADNSGHFPGKNKQKADRTGNDASRPEPPRSRGPFGRKELPLETSYESRFFTADFLTDSGEIILNTDHIAAILDDEALRIAKKTQAMDKERGFIGAYRFMKKEETGRLLIIFLDCGRKLDAFWNMTGIHAMISVLSLAAVSCILFILSGKIVRPVAQAHEKQKQFISAAGHEIKTPLTIIDADSELLRLDMGENSEWLEDICIQTKRLTNLTNELLQLSKLDEYSADQTRIEFPLSDLIIDTAKSFQTLADKEQVRFRLCIEPMLSYYGDENQIRRLAGILFDNAVKYSAGTEPVQVELKKSRHGIEFSVENQTEQPVSREQCSCFFDRFYRTEQAQRSEKGGYGLGLAIAKSIAEAHHGEIMAETDGERVRIRAVFADSRTPGKRICPVFRRYS